jgi:hypothetical protein
MSTLIGFYFVILYVSLIIICINAKKNHHHQTQNSSTSLATNDLSKSSPTNDKGGSKKKGRDKKNLLHYNTSEDFDFNEVQGREYRLYQPFAAANIASKSKSKKKNDKTKNKLHVKDRLQEVGLLAPPEIWVSSMERSLKYLDTISVIKEGKLEARLNERARDAYLDFISQMITGLAFGPSEKSVVSYLYDGKKAEVRNFDQNKRNGGLDWTYLGKTMIGVKRLENLRNLTSIVLQRPVSGAFVQTGVWRGGVDMLVRAMFRTFHQPFRPNILCDSFAGLPPGNASVDKLELGWNNNPYMSVPEEEVIRNFQQYSLQDPNVYFAKGFFNVTMPILRTQVKRIAILRLDGDMYQSTVDVLYNLYSQVEIGGFVIMDDWFGFPSKHAVEDFFHCHGESIEVIPIDSLSVYWQKTKHFTVKYSLYESKSYKCK